MLHLRISHIETRRVPQSCIAAVPHKLAGGSDGNKGLEARGVDKREIRVDFFEFPNFGAIAGFPRRSEVPDNVGVARGIGKKYSRKWIAAQSASRMCVGCQNIHMLSYSRIH